MLEYLPQEVKDGLDKARRDAARRKGRMHVQVGDQEYVVLRYWDQGFALSAADAPHLRGHVDLYDGPRHMGRCLIVASGQERDEMVYEFKQNTPVFDRPPRDFAPDDFTPAGLLT
ncbi:hypothetical protein [Oceaniglobus ichthyenteri]|uniref:hypothetical protein n=1 Tax=Oceaniglobus ichthyenteri TaxID=2136177 RepID=UPI000D34757B|nr:hypothetical protein [Oceaniglobus ichthyenteri]